MKTFALILWLASGDVHILDTGLSRFDCEAVSPVTYTSSAGSVRTITKADFVQCVPTEQAFHPLYGFEVLK